MKTSNLTNILQPYIFNTMKYLPRN